jgi:Oxidoreductase family, NAD-binding Rossmann fold/Oxidoreductase family, C-terminal alpha/beta domain
VDDAYDELLARCEGVAVATPTGTHAELVTVAARAGRPVFCEKPIYGDRATTLEVLGVVAESGVPLQVGFHRRFDPVWVSVAQRLAELGEITLCRTSLRDMTPPPVEFIAGGGGFFADVTVHDLDVARWLMGTLAAARVETPRVVEWRTPGRACYPLPKDFEERYPTAYVEEFDAFARCVLDGTPPRCTGLGPRRVRPGRGRGPVMAQWPSGSYEVRPDGGRRDV